jgi:hypothetical protein
MTALLAERADAPQGGRCIGRAGGDMELLFRADDKIAIGQDGLQTGADLGRLDESLLAGVVSRKTP